MIPGSYIPRQEYLLTQEKRDLALVRRQRKKREVLREHSKKLTPLKVGDVVQVQNQRRPHAQKWFKSGVIIEVLPFDQLKVKMDGTGQSSLRNHQFLRKVTAKPRMDNLIRDKKMGKDLIHQGNFGVPSASNKCTIPAMTPEPAVR